MARAKVITERDVRRAANGGSRELDATGAIITPSALDAAARSGVALKGSKLAPRQRNTPRAVSGSRATASPGDVPAQPHGTAPSPVSVQRIAIGADHGGVALRDAILARLRELGHDVTDHGTTGTLPVDYPDYAIAVARAVATGGAQIGIMVDGAGIGSCMTANKVPGVRAAREHNNANVLTLGGGLIGTRLALAIVETFLSTSFGGGRHAARVAKIDALDGARVQR
jgi:ribose 5-phosphate isomerase B